MLYVNAGSFKNYNADTLNMHNLKVLFGFFYTFFEFFYAQIKFSKSVLLVVR